MTAVQRRAGVHAALGEPTRLALVDQLMYTDASPGELATRLNMATNLLAHHLRVLDEAGVIRRVRSQADRRRSYVQLCLDDPGLQAILSSTGPRLVEGKQISRVVFVGTTDAVRSQLAASTWHQASDLPVTSAGIHPEPQIDPRVVNVGHRHGLQIGKQPPTQVAGMLRPHDLVVAVSDHAHEQLAKGEGRLHWAIPDPTQIDTPQAFEATFQDVARRVDQLVCALH